MQYSKEKIYTYKNPKKNSTLGKFDDQNEVFSEIKKILFDSEPNRTLDNLPMPPRHFALLQSTRSINSKNSKISNLFQNSAINVKITKKVHFERPIKEETISWNFLESFPTKRLTEFAPKRNYSPAKNFDRKEKKYRLRKKSIESNLKEKLFLSKSREKKRRSLSITKMRKYKEYVRANQGLKTFKVSYIESPWNSKVMVLPNEKRRSRSKQRI